MHDSLLIPGVIQEDDPKPTISGMIDLRQDPQGHLTYLEAIPAQKEDHPGQEQKPDWSPLFAAAGLDMSKFQSATPQWTSLAASDTRQAWIGQWPGFNRRPLRVEAGACHGRPVFFSLIGPWTKASRMPSSDTTQLAARILVILVLVAPLFGAVFLAHWNVTHGKGDRQGAMRLAALVFSLHMALWIFEAHIASVENFLYLLFVSVGTALLWGGAVWTLYLAIEPYIRRYWPQGIISWTRALSGRWRDPLVGRDVLYGVILGVVFCCLYGVRNHIEALYGAAPAMLSTDYLGSARAAFGQWFLRLPSSVSSTLGVFLLLFFCRALLRKPWLSAMGFVLLLAAVKSVGSDYPTLEWPMQILLYIVLAAGALRYGLVTLAVAIFTADMALNVPVTLNPSAWYFSNATFAIASVGALAFWGFYTSLAGETPWKRTV
jgi:hypothetical protein